MRKILLTIAFPFWTFFSRTWVGIMVIFMLIICTPAIIINLIIPGILNETGSQAEGIGIGIAILSLISAPFISIPFFIIDDYFLNAYRKLKYYE